MRIFVKNVFESQENCIKGDLASCNTVYAHIRREAVYNYATRLLQINDILEA